MSLGHTPGSQLLHVHQQLQGNSSISGAELQLHRMLHHVKQVKYLGARSQGKMCVMVVQNDPGAKHLCA